ncbi:phosphatase PAP2 family protein [Hoylesella marshii]|uniref:phosphatase PAP2 family protein n=1 Tax=Hoylesella marshii TaxID=189722 RepID=UPI0028CFF875|nr:phosphatase PAP2 family protein [Hoylesella marshii]
MFLTIIDIDRFILGLFNGSSSLFLDSLVTILTSGLTWIPLYIALLYLVIKNNETMAQITLVIGCVALCIVLSHGMSAGIVKPLIGRFRPGNDPIYKYTIDVVGNMRGTDFSFFSSHASNTFSVAVFFILLVRNRLLSLALVAWAMVNCWTRLYLGVHYPSDILVGMIWGCVVGIIGYSVYTRLYGKLLVEMPVASPQHAVGKYNTEDVDVVLCTLSFILVCALVGATFTTL